MGSTNLKKDNIYNNNKDETHINHYQESKNI